MKTTKSFHKAVAACVEKLYNLQERVEEAMNEYDEKDELTEKQEEAQQELSELYDAVQDAIDYIEMYSEED